VVPVRCIVGCCCCNGSLILGTEPGAVAVVCGWGLELVLDGG